MVSEEWTFHCRNIPLLDGLASLLIRIKNLLSYYYLYWTKSRVLILATPFLWHFREANKSQNFSRRPSPFSGSLWGNLIVMVGFASIYVSICFIKGSTRCAFIYRLPYALCVISQLHVQIEIRLAASIPLVCPVTLNRITRINCNGRIFSDLFATLASNGIVSYGIR